MEALQHRIRRFAQRWFTSLPIRVAPFSEISGRNSECADGIYYRRPGFSGVLRREPGTPFTVHQTQFLGPPAPRLADESTAYTSIAPDRVLFGLADAGVHDNQGAVYDPHSRSFVAETFESWTFPDARHPGFRAPGITPAEKVPGRSFLLTGLGATTFYHFLIENLPRYLWAREQANNCDQLLVTDTGASWKEAWLRLAGWRGAIRFLPSVAHLRCEQLLFTARLVRHFEPSSWAVDTLRQAMLPRAAAATTTAPAVIWLDRRRQTARQADWEAALLERLAPHVAAIDFSDLDPPSQIATLRSARVLIGLHGAAFANMIFCPPGTQVIELLTARNFPWYSRLAQACGHHHVAVQVGPRPASLDDLAHLILPLLRAGSGPA